MGQMEFVLSQSQLQVINSPISSRIFLEGPSGTGKTTAAVSRLVSFLEKGIAAESILILTPQRTLAAPYQEALEQIPNYNGGQVTNLTLGGLARRMIGLFWPQIVEVAGFAQPDMQPTFLTLETAQYYLAQLVRPLLQEGFFSSVTIDRNRLYSQIIDNLNKAAVVGFDSSEIAERLISAWGGDPGQLRIYEDAQTCANLFRDFCLKRNMLDFSLQVEVFRKYLWHDPICHKHLTTRFRHIIFDNIEEDTPITHDLMSEWLTECASALIIMDANAGFRRFLGANPDTGSQLRQFCDIQINLNSSFVMNNEISTLEKVLVAKINKTSEKFSESELPPNVAMEFEIHRFFPSMLDWVCTKIANLVNESNISPGDIVILSPFLSDALRFSLLTRLENLNIPIVSHRPSRALRDEPATLCVLTLTLLSHPLWLEKNPLLIPNQFDIAYALVQAIENLDLIRAQLLTSTLIKSSISSKQVTIGNFDQLIPEMQERISYQLGEKFEYLRNWIENYVNGPPLELDFFISRLFGEVLSQPGFGFHNNFQAAEITFNLIESIQKFRWTLSSSLTEDEKPIGLEYLETVRDGILAAQYIRSWENKTQDAVLLAPAYTFLMYNQAVNYQFWLDVGSKSWAERLYQPLTQPYVLSRSWDPKRIWTDFDEEKTSQDSLYRLVSGLLHRCRQGIYLGLSDLGENGYEQRGPLLAAIQKTLQVFYGQ